MQSERKVWHWLVLALLSLIWGTSYILMKKGLESFSTNQIGSMRIIITGLSLLPVAINNLSKLTRLNIKSILIIGFFGSGIPAFLFPLAQTRIESSMAGMLNSLSPVFTLLIGIMFYKQHMIRSQVAGVILGLIGAAGLLYNGSLSFNFYGIFVVFATILYGISTNEVSKIKGINGLQITSLAFFVMIPFALIVLLSTDLQAAVKTEHWVLNLGYIAVLSVFGSAVALALFYLLVRDTSPVFAAMVTYFIPVIATLWGLADNEHLAPHMLISVLLILAGVYLINRPGFLQNIRRIIR